jgi:hypothetical protein
MRLPSPAKTALIASAGMIALVLWLDRAPEELPVEALTGFQDADAPLFLPADGTPRLHVIPAWELARIPVALRRDAPLGSEQGALTWLDPATGDLNGIGGHNSDLGDPVFAVADGWVVYAGEPFADSGKTVVLAHRTPEGSLIQSLYGGLESVAPAIGDLTPRGARIGTVGTARGHRAAGLDFQMRPGGALDFGSAGEEPGEPAGRAEADLAPPPLGIALKEGE